MSNHSPYNEEDLLSRLAKDDILAFDELYWKYQRAVYNNVYKLTRDSGSADDITQEVFIALWEKRNMIDTGRSVAGWLFVSSYNRSVNALKKKLRELKAYQSIGQEDTHHLYDQSVADVQLNILEKAMAELSPQKRRVFELCKLQGRSYEEAATEMKISKHTVKEYLSAAVSFIKEYARQHPDLSIQALVLFIAAN